MLQRMSVGPWSAEDTAELKVMWEAGIPDPTIAHRLGRTIESVISKANRMGYLRGIESARKKVRGSGGPARKEPQPRIHQPKKAAPEVGKYAITDMDSLAQCRFPTGHDGHQILFCGAKTTPGARQSWCKEHFHRVYPTLRYPSPTSPSYRLTMKSVFPGTTQPWLPTVKRESSS